MNFSRFSLPEPRMDTPIMVRLTKTDRRLLKRAARERKLPMSTIAYLCLKHWLDSEYGDTQDKGGAK